MTGRKILSATIIVALLFTAAFTNYFFSERKLKPGERQASSLSGPATTDATSDGSTLQEANVTQQEEALLSDQTRDASRKDPSMSLPSLDEEEPVDTNAKFSDRLPDLFDQRRQDSATFITRDDLPLELQQQFDQVMESYKRNGYLETDEAFIEHMHAIYNQIVPLDPEDLANTVELQSVENTPLSDMEYIGAIPDRDPENADLPIHGIKRIYKHEEGYITLYESNMKNSEALLQKEFVNESINGYPATQITYCSPSKRCFTQLVFLTNNKRYELSFSGDIGRLGSENLVSIAQSLDLESPPNAATDVK
jgi:hypothetical protein